MAIDKRYQVFISSTFVDLVNERQEVLKAVLELNHMPAGMELFPAGDEAAWQLIRDVIDGSDYYVLIIGGRYGSLDDAGVGYTEKEYDYAIASRKPVLALLHKDPEKIPREKTETDPGAWEKLKKFRAKVEKAHTCSYWTSPDELKSKAIVALTQETKRHPQIGWIHADQMPTQATLADILSLRERIAELETELARERTEPPSGTAELAQGDDEHEIEIDYKVAPDGEDYLTEDWGGSVSATWNAIFAALAPLMINEASVEELRSALRALILDIAKVQRAKDKGMKGKHVESVRVPDRDLDTVIVQLRALGLITSSERKRSLKDTSAYWTLTPYGDRLMVQLRALRRREPGKALSGRIVPAAAETEKE